jgi:outer membrane protein assembly factor BamC
MTSLRTLAVLLAPLALASGCGLFGGGKTDEYQRASGAREQPLEVPPDLTKPTADERFAVPDPRASTSFSQYNKDRGAAPQGTLPASSSASVLPGVPNARLERGGDQRWIVAKAEPAQIWPLAREFWLENGFALVREAPEAGILETNWRESRANVETTGLRGVLSRALPGMYSTGERDRFRTRLEKGLEPGTTEIYVSHRGLEEVYTSQAQDQTRWQPRGTGTDRDLEAEMLSRLLVRLGEPSRRTAAAPVAPGSKPAPVAAPAGTAAIAPVAANAVLQNSGAGPLTVNDEFDRAWRRVGLALDRVGFTVEDRDRSKGTYFVRYIDPDAESKGNEGFLDKLAFWRPASKAAQPQFRIVVTDSGGGLSQVVVQDAKGEVEASSTGKRILSLLYEQLR